MIDKNAPLYDAYMEECLALQKEFLERDEAIFQHMKDIHYRGMDDEESFALHKELCKRLKAIQKKYGFDKVAIGDTREGMENSQKSE